MLRSPDTGVGGDPAVLPGDPCAQVVQPTLPAVHQDPLDGLRVCLELEVRPSPLRTRERQVVAHRVHGLRSKDLLAPDGMASAGGELAVLQQVELVDMVIDIGIPLGYANRYRAG